MFNTKPPENQARIWNEMNQPGSTWFPLETMTAEEAEEKVFPIFRVVPLGYSVKDDGTKTHVCIIGEQLYDPNYASKLA